VTHTDRRLTDLIASVPAGELSSLIGLRVLANATEPGEWMPVSRLVEEVRREYSRRSTTPGEGVTMVSPPWELTPSSEDGMAGYIHDHVIRRWSAEGVLEYRPAAEDFAEAPTEPGAVRIVPGLDLDRGTLLHPPWT
jgi:hypothetical protein